MEAAARRGGGQGAGWRDSEGLDGYREMPRRPAASPPTPPRRSPREPSRRLEGAKVEKLRKQSCGVSEMEEGEVAPDPEPKGRNLGTQGKGVTGAPVADNAGKEERKSKDGVVVEAGQVTHARDEKSAPEVAEKVGGDEVPVQDETANVVDQVLLEMKDQFCAGIQLQ